MLKLQRMNNPSYDRALALFSNANSTGMWDDAAFSAWLAGANTHAWNQLEEAWQREGNPEKFSWPVLKRAVKTFSSTFCAPPFETLIAFFFPPGVVYQEGHWLDWQTDEVKKDIFRTAQGWMEQSSVGLEEQAGALLLLAVVTDNMPLWRQAPEKCIKELDSDEGMRLLNSVGAEHLLVSDIERVPTNLPNVSMVEQMLKAVQYERRAIARCIELKAGPGMWLQYIFSGNERSLEGRRMTAWNNMKLDGVDAWAMSQYIRPATSFEASFEGMSGYKLVREHDTWARQWWVQCMLGMDYAQAHRMACCVRTPLVQDETYPVDELLSSSDREMLS